MASSPHEFAQQMYAYLAEHIYDEQACMKYIEEQMVLVFDTAFAKGRDSLPKEEHSRATTQAGSLYGLPCKTCGRYFAASLGQCPECAAGSSN